MKPYREKNLTSYVRLFTIFEKHLKKYHNAFDNDYYFLTYTVRRQPFKSDPEIKVFLTINNKILWFDIVRKSLDLRNVIENYCYIFSITNITILKPYALFSLRNDYTVFGSRHKLPIEDRISFELVKNKSPFVD